MVLAPLLLIMDAWIDGGTCAKILLDIGQIQCWFGAELAAGQFFAGEFENVRGEVCGD